MCTLYMCKTGAIKHNNNELVFIVYSESELQYTDIEVIYLTRLISLIHMAKAYSYTSIQMVEHRLN